MARRWSPHNYGQLRHLIERSLAACPGFGGRIEVESRIQPIGESLWHQNYSFWIQGRTSPSARAEQGYILRLHQKRYDWQACLEPRERLRREGETLHALTRMGFLHPTPKFVCFVADDQSQVIGMIETALPGFSLDAVKDRSTLRAICREAANVHRMPVGEFGHLAGSADRAEHVKARLPKMKQLLASDVQLSS